MREVLHVSDVHFGPPHLREASDGLLSLVERRRPDLVVISGDLTQRAKPGQFRQARDLVDRLETPPLAVPTLAVPGNHDVPMYRFWERAFDPFGAYRRHFDPELEPTFEDDEMLVVGVNTAFNWTIKDGRMTRAALRRLEEVLAGASPGVAKIVVAHHQLVPAPRYDTQRVLKNAHRAVQVLHRAGVELVLSGHLHQSWIGTTEAYYPSGRRPVLLLHSGTTTSSRGRGSERHQNTCNWIRLTGEAIEISNLAWEADGGGFRVRSRHRYPRLGAPDYALETF